jgi:hypothetical protein
MPPGHECRPGGRADRSRGVAAHEPHAVRGQPVDGGRPVEGASCAAEIPGAEIVGQDDEQVRPPARRRGGRRRFPGGCRRIPPAVEVGPQAGDEVGMRGGEIGPLVGIGGDVIQFDLAPLVPVPRRLVDGPALARWKRLVCSRCCRHDQLPALADGPPPEQAPRRVVDVDERVRGARSEELLPGGHRRVVEEVHAGQPGGRRDAAGREHRREDVDGARQRVAHPRLDGAGAAEHDRRPQAAVVGGELRPRREPRGSGILDPAVVGHVHDERVGRELLPVEMLEQVADGAVEPLHVAPVSGDVHAVGRGGIVLDEIGRGIVRVVRQHRRVPDEEGTAVLLAAADEVLDRLHRGAADRQALVAVSLALRHARAESTPGKVSLPPLAGLQAPVARGGEQPRQRRPGVEMAIHPLATSLERGLPGGTLPGNTRRFRRVVADDPMLVGIPSRDERCEARAAEAARHVSAAEDEAFPRQPVEVGRPQVRVPHEAIVAPVLVVGDDEHDVGPARRRRRGRGAGERPRGRAGGGDHGPRNDYPAHAHRPDLLPLLAGPGTDRLRATPGIMGPTGADRITHAAGPSPCEPAATRVEYRS